MGGPALKEGRGLRLDGYLSHVIAKGSSVLPVLDRAQALKMLRWGRCERCPTLTLLPSTSGTTSRMLEGCRVQGLCKWTLCNPSFWKTWP